MICDRQKRRNASFIAERVMILPAAAVHEADNATAEKDMGQIGEAPIFFIDAFLQNRHDLVTRVMAYHPNYLNPFLKMYNFMFHGDGPLPYTYRHYIAIMAAARHRCSYLINFQKQEFLNQGGDIKWLQGTENIPKKLRDLNEINKILAHRPWLMNKKHIERLTRGKDNWSISEIVHAIVLLTHFHALSGFVFGCGIDEEKENAGTFQLPGGITEEDRALSTNSKAEDDAVEVLMRKMKSISEKRSEPSQEERVRVFENVESQSAELGPDDETPPLPVSEMSKYIDDPDFEYQEFARRGNASEIPTFRVQDYSWEDHGFSLANRLYSDVGMLLDEKFKVTYNLTYYTMGRKHNVDTSTFRRAIWNYIQCLYGIRHDDYDYKDVNELLERDLKTYIKTIVCYPDRTSKKDLDRIMREFRHSEKIHVNLMILEARLQAELLYALRTIMRYMT